MRMSPRKIHALAEKIIGMLEDDREAEILTSRADAESAVAAAMTDDFEEEDDIDEEVDRMMEQYRSQIERENLDAETMRRRFKDQIAKKRGFVV
jgi:hypothetical protein